MIPFNFDYYRPDTLEEATRAYRELDSRSLEPVYYSGGSEIISMARVHNIYTKAVIDLKAIPECNVLEFREDRLFIGSSVTLSRISEENPYPLLSKACSRIADHTMQCRITIGGNLGGTIIYREASLPLLLSDCEVIVTSSGSLSRVPLAEVFRERLLLPRGEFIVQFVIRKEYAAVPYVHVKKTRNEKIDYPLVSVAALKKDGRIRLALSGVCPFPFRSADIEDRLNDMNDSWGIRIDKALEYLPAPILNDISGSNGYRKFVLKNTLLNTLRTLEAMH
ncbi:MAG TPA: FAD binding domain-containing protein [Clostridia bacterium]|nr:FAD binding domain-containing protein [Clostridia bacterium]